MPRNEQPRSKLRGIEHPSLNSFRGKPRGIEPEEIDVYEREILNAFEKGKLKSVATKAELSKFRAAARATAIKDRRVNIRLSSRDLSDIQAKALKEGIPYQTLIASVLHKYVSGRLTESKVPDVETDG